MAVMMKQLLEMHVHESGPENTYYCSRGAAFLVAPAAARWLGANERLCPASKKKLVWLAKGGTLKNFKPKVRVSEAKFVW
jgi:hypothetical protein